MQYPKNKPPNAEQRTAEVISSLGLILLELDALNLALPAIKIAEAIDHLSEDSEKDTSGQFD